jgi:hypothetical protein
MTPLSCALVWLLVAACAAVSAQQPSEDEFGKKLAKTLRENSGKRLKEMFDVELYLQRIAAGSEELERVIARPSSTSSLLNPSAIQRQGLSLTDPLQEDYDLYSGIEEVASQVSNRMPHGMLAPLLGKCVHYLRKKQRGAVATLLFRVVGFYQCKLRANSRS